MVELAMDDFEESLALAGPFAQGIHDTPGQMLPLRRGEVFGGQNNHGNI
jgi:hypothetical protein